jgi:two-component system, chemotaxis family, chemotaxis protein CheY
MNEKTILITDDEPHMRRLLQFTLAKTKQKLVMAVSGEEALARVQAGPIDLLVIDVGLPGMSGFDTVKAIKNLPGNESLPVIMLTSRGHTDIRDEAAKLGVRAFLTKPFSPTELASLAQDFLRA